LCIPTFYGTLDTTFEEKRTSVPAFPRVFTGGVPLGYGVQRRDIEVQFPLSRRAFLTLTHDLKPIEILEKADRRKRENIGTSDKGRVADGTFTSGSVSEIQDRDSRDSRDSGHP
jgi:hypothetical protein